MKKSVLKKLFFFATLLTTLLFNARANDHHHEHPCNHRANAWAYNMPLTVKCAACGKISALKTCSDCNGTGNKNYNDAGKPYEEDPKCYGSGQVHTDCGHAYINPATNPPVKCAECGKISSLKTCSNCNGTGNKNYKDPTKVWEDDNNCKGSGKLHIQCSHAYVDLVVDEIPELIFANPVRISGEDGKEGAVYLFAKVAPGIDANLLLKKFSRKDIYVQSIDQFYDAALKLNLGWEKSFQPRFGLQGTVPANENWYIDFELTFLKAGTNIKESVDKFTVTSLDVDGDGGTLNEFVIMEKASSVAYSENSFLNKSTPATPVVTPTCPKCGEQSLPVICKKCGGDGLDGKKKCGVCKGVGKVYHTCGHPWDGQAVVAQGPQVNRANIDTAATDVMATYVYNNKEVINFRIGANSGASGTYGGAGVRLNSMWFKGFNLNPREYSALPVKLHHFKAAKEANGVALSWSAESETSLSHFVVERSIDGKTFKALATVAATASNSNYSYKDLAPASGNATISYRIRMIEATQEVSYSPVITVRFSKDGESSAAIATYPNPVQEQLNVTVPAAWQGQTMQVAIYNSNGVQVEAAQYQSAGAVETIAISHLPKGVYIVKAGTKKGIAQQTVYKN